ncbi:MAG TPA: ring-cleaving dioxygenase [Thermoanaerobaculia bacterium]|jgi:glyoxalase family protein|nr:ring-cleaving dioxygenase [Thermoanaerobaculia bacterium]
MERQIGGIHHVTAIARNPQMNVDFYAGVLGLRLVKKTVNFDDPGTYHFYYGDGQGHPGTIMTFFPWPMARLGSRGAGQATVTSFSVPEGSLGWWAERLDRMGVEHDDPRPRFDEEVLTVLDPDHLQIELVAQPGDSRTPWDGGPVPTEHAIRGFEGVTLMEWNPEITSEVLTGLLGFRSVSQAGDRFRFEVGAGGPGTRVDVLAKPDAPRGHVSAGTVHHVAWRTPDDAQQRAWYEEIRNRGLHVSPILDRQYFHSIYFREPGGVLFEIATDPPGFTKDEPEATLGTDLKLPPWLEPDRKRIEEVLPKIEVPNLEVVQ